MSETFGPGAAKDRKEKRPIEILRDRRGGISKELKEYFSQQQRIHKSIRAALKGGPRTVPEIAVECNLPSPSAMWHLMALRRHGAVVEAAERNGYILYGLKGA